MSTPSWHHNVIRPDSVDVQYTNLKGELVRETLTSLSARVFQHEFDHLQGFYINNYKLLFFLLTFLGILMTQKSNKKKVNPLWKKYKKKVKLDQQWLN